MKRNNKTINKPLLTKSRKARYYAEPDATNNNGTTNTTSTGKKIGKGLLGGLQALSSGAELIQGQRNKVKSIENAGNQMLDTVEQNTENDIKSFSAADSMDSLYDAGSFGLESNIGYRDLLGSKSDAAMNIMGSGISGAATGAGIGGGWGALGGGIFGMLTGGIGWKKQKDKAKEMAKKVNEAVNAANIQKTASYSNAVENLEDKNNLLALMRDAQNNYATGGGIHIKKANRGKFTESANRAGMGVQEYARHILANKDDYSSTLIKRANFARNAAKWHAEGGSLNSNGANFTNGLTYIDNGGTHEKNPLEGVQIGMDNQGIPNLVEEGEVIYNDYVFTNRWKTPKNVKEALGVKKKSSITYADVAKDLSAESKERVNDPITKDTLERNLEILAQAQEADRVKKESRKAKKEFNSLTPEEQLGIMQNVQQYQQEQDMNNQFAIGGRLVRKYDDASGNLSYAKSFDSILDEAIRSVDFDRSLKTMEKRDMQNINPLEDIAKNKQTTFNRNNLTFNSPEQQENLLAGTKNPKRTNGNKGIQNLARYAPVMGNAIAALNNLLTKPDYSRANALKNEARRVGNWTPVKPKTLTEKQQYRPYDPYLDMNRLTAQANANRQALLNQSAGNRATAMQALQGINTSTLESLADMRLKADQLNLDRLNKVAEFNRETSKYNSDAELRAAMANESARLNASNARAGLMEKAFAMQDAADNQRDAAISSSLSGLFEDIGNIGREKDIKDMIRFNIETGSLGNIPTDILYKALKG